MTNVLTGKWFHSFTEDGKVKWQGQVLDKTSSDHFYIQLYDWLLGAPSVGKVVSVDAMTDWNFYDTDDEMRAVYETRYKSVA